MGPTRIRQSSLATTIAVVLPLVALFIAPVLVFASYFIAPVPLELSFSRAEVGTLFIGVIIVAMVYGDGQANWFKGVQLITIYLIIAMMFYFMPGVAS